MARLGRSLLAILLTTLLFVGCGGQEQPKQRQTPPPGETTAQEAQTASEGTTAEERTAAITKATSEKTPAKTTQAASSPSAAQGSLEQARSSTNVEETVAVTRVVDGDTIEISPTIDGVEDVRLIGVDTPETKKPNCQIQPYGPEASAFTEEQLDGRTVGLEFDRERTDRYDRLLAYVYPSEDTMFNETLLREGYAHVSTFPPNTRYVSRFQEAEAEAKAAGRGIWGLSPEALAALLAGVCTPEQPPPEAPQQQPQQQSTPKAPGPTPNPPAVPAGGARCSDFATEAEAIAALPSNPQLDRDGDGKACESLP